jgi:hypothetical protein
MKVIMAFILLLLVPLGVCAQGDKVNSNNSAQSQVDGIAAKLASGEVGRIEILQIPARVLTRTRITPPMLEKQFHYKLTIRDARGGPYQNKLAEVTKSLAVRPATEMADIRWGVVFYGVDDGRLLALYFDKSGSSGAVGDSPVSFKGDLFKWLDGNFSACFR